MPPEKDRTAELKILNMAPLEFLSKYSVSPPNSYNQGALPDSTQAGINPDPSAYLTGSHNVVDSLLKMKDADKIAYGMLRPDGGDHYEMRFYNPSQVSAEQQKTLLPLWYLPWKADHITKMKIPQKQNGVNTPDLFFTSALSGCSVFVKGATNSPSVYHAGSDNMRDWNANPKLDPNTIRHWQILFQRYARNTVNLGEANKGAYLTELKDSPDLQAYMNFLKLKTKGSISIQNLVPAGTVFGIRDAGGNWSFYLQQKILVQYTTFTVRKKFGGLLGKETIQSETKTYQRPMSLQKIFPGGTGQARIWNTEPMMVG